MKWDDIWQAYILSVIEKSRATAAPEPFAHVRITANRENP